jgi:predicted nucleic acid-binding Zn finger protein
MVDVWEFAVPSAKERLHLPPDVDQRVGYGIGLFRIGRPGRVMEFLDRFDYIVDPTVKTERYPYYYGFVSLGDEYDPLSIRGAWCSCPDHGKAQYRGFGFCKHTMWAALRAVHAQFERPVQLEVVYHPEKKQLIGLQLNDMAMFPAPRESLRDTIIRIKDVGFRNVPVDGKLVSPWDEANGLVSRTYTRP